MCLALMLVAVLLSFGLYGCGSASSGKKGHSQPPGGNTPNPMKVTMTIKVDDGTGNALTKDVQVADQADALAAWNSQIEKNEMYLQIADQKTNQKVIKAYLGNQIQISNDDLETADYYTLHLDSQAVQSEKGGQFVSYMVTPGGNQIWLYGTVINRTQYWPSVAVDYTAQVVGGNLTVTFFLPIGTYLHIGYSLGNPATGLQNRVDNISFNSGQYPAAGNPATYSVLGTAPNQWPVLCLIANRDQDSASTITGNPNCTAVLRQVVIRVTGNSTNNIYDDTILPYTGAQPGEQVRIQTNLWMSTAILPDMTWVPADAAYEYVFYTVADTQGFWVHLDRPSREPTAPPGTYEPELGGSFIDIKPLGGGANVICSAELVNWNDVDPGAGYWYAAYGNGSACPFAPTTDNRAFVVTGP